MVFVNGVHPIIILEFGEELLSNNSNICVIQSNQRWDQAAIDDLRKQATPKQQVLYLHSGTSDVQILTEDKSAPSEPTNDLPLCHGCDTCKFSDLSITEEPCHSCSSCCDCLDGYPRWEPKEEKHEQTHPKEKDNTET